MSQGSKGDQKVNQKEVKHQVGQRHPRKKERHMLRAAAKRVVRFRQRSACGAVRSFSDSTDKYAEHQEQSDHYSYVVLKDRPVTARWFIEKTSVHTPHTKTQFRHKFTRMMFYILIF